MEKYKCTVCDYVFESETEPKTCPECHSHKIRKISYIIKKKNNFEA